MINFKNLKINLKQGFRIFILMLFLMSMAVQPVLARMPEILFVQTQQEGLQLTQQAQIFYQAGQFEKAVQFWQEAAASFAQKGDKLNQVMAFSNLALTYQKLNQWQEAEATINQSLNLLLSLKNSSESLKILAQTLDIKGRFQWQTGQIQNAIDSWVEAAKIYQEMGDKTRLSQNQLNQALAFQDLGLYPKVCQTLLQIFEVEQDIEQGCNLSDSTVTLLLEKPDDAWKLEGLRSLGNLLRVVGNIEQSQTLLEGSLNIAKKQENFEAIATIYLNLGNTERSIAERTRRLSFKDGDSERVKKTKRQAYLEDLEKAINLYQEAAEVSPVLLTQIQAQLNQLSLLIDSEQWSKAEQLWLVVYEPLKTLPPTRTGIYAQVNFAKSLLALQLANSPQNLTMEKIISILENALTQAQSLGDIKAQAYTLGTFGKLYEQAEQWKIAEEYTQQALSIAPTYNSPDIAYQFSWQLGRIRKQQEDRKGAIAAYTNAFDTLQSLRSDLVAINPEVQFSFRESVEPVYRELVDLQLQEANEFQIAGDAQNLQLQIRDVRQVIESLQLAELNNFFRDACVDANPRIIDEVAQTAAIIYPIILPNRLEIIVSLPTQPEPTFRLYTTKVNSEEINKTVRQLQGELLQPPRDGSTATTPEIFTLTRQVYDWLIRPAEVDLKNSQVDTLVFVLDGTLRNIPMGTLYDGNEFLVQKYAIALTPGLQLLNPQPLTQEDLKALLAGATDAPTFGEFGTLPAVDEELNQIAETIPNHEKRQNEEFTRENLQDLINQVPFPVVHLATHGQFGSNAEETFILTYNDRIDVTTLDQILRKPDEKRPIELLVLSACETVRGDDRAALGLAGIAVRAGARSTVATLWTVEDQSTARLMVDFYRELANRQTKSNKAQALRTAQLNLLNEDRTRHPFYWAPFVLVGNWQ
ncbi:tetratricopeptide repeat family protein [Lyngbya aestuarii BL J]|uniref:Tetratricopeptide repeat family protein n=1 Tax=Lyngbya aestuarii BL J TaxID=1348334 RepID=U7QMZ4_9CYAN|nr:CHAT domain-containing protein [Lyngbya aestuarii]ERT07781.1 tetratricopeptide repeat family protein [Lyngbya aestuarii BL J]